MLNTIIRFSLRFRGAIYALALMMACYGLYTLAHSRLDVFPEFVPPMAIIQTEAPGLSSAQVEMLVTQPIESALRGTIDLQSLRSKSLQGLSVVTLVFDDSADVFRVRQLVLEKLTSLGSSLPAGVDPPKLLPLTTASSNLLVIGLTSRSRNLMDLHDTAEWTIRRQLLAVPGVADAIVFGGEPRELQIKVDPIKLLRYRLSIQEVMDAARLATGIRGAGFIENTNQRITLYSHGQTLTPEALAKVILRWNKGVGISIGDLATVSYGSAPLIGGASIMGTPGVIVLVEGQYGSNTLAVTKALEDALSSLKPTLVAQDIVLWQDIFRPANFITQATRHLGLALLIGGVMVVSVLFLFLMNFRTAVISAIAIPLSLLAAVIILHALNITLNTMTLGGLAIALGEVVDDAIIDVENIYRRLRQNSQLAQPLSSFKVVLRASLEVRLAVVFATFIVVLVFLPVLKLSGVAGKLFAPLGVAYILAVLASLAIALTLTPALALALLSKNLTAAREPRWVGGMKARYIFLLSQVERHVKVVMVTVFILTLVALATLPFLRGSFIPELREGHFIVHLGLIPGTSLTETLEIGNRVSRAIMRIPGVHLVAQTVGRANEIVDPAGVQLGEIHVDLNPTNAAEQDEILRAIKSVLARFPGITSSVNTFLIERIDESISGVTAPVAIKIVGDDLDVIDQKAQEVARLVAAIPGAASVNIEAPPGTLELSIRLKHEQLQRWGFRPVEVLDAIQNAYQGAKVAQVFDGNRVYDVRVILAASVNANLSKVGELALRNPDGQAIQLQMLASIQQVVGRAQISHTDGQRLQTVSVRVGARALDAFVQDVRAQLAQHLQLPQGTYLVFSGESEARSQSRNDLLMYGALAFAGIFVLLCFAVNRRRSVVLILVNLPFALVGGVFSVAVTGCNLSLGAMVGFITLFGISLRNSIMLISHYEFLIYKDNLPWGLETAVRGASERLVPIVMTALITALALAPLAIMSGEPGNEIEGPMAIVILGGLISSTLLNLIVLPTLACRYGNFEQK